MDHAGYCVEDRSLGSEEWINQWKTADGILDSTRYSTLTHLILTTTIPDHYLHFINEKMEAIKKFSNLPRATWLVSGSALSGAGANEIGRQTWEKQVLPEKL